MSGVLSHLYPKTEEREPLNPLKSAACGAGYEIMGGG